MKQDKITTNVSIKRGQPLTRAVNRVFPFLLVIFFLVSAPLWAEGFNGDPGCSEMTTVIPLVASEFCESEKEWCSCEIEGGRQHEVEKIQDAQLKMWGRVILETVREDAQKSVSEQRQNDEKNAREDSDVLSDILIEDVAVGDGGYFYRRAKMEGAFVAYDYVPIWGFDGDPKREWVLEYKATLSFSAGVCRAELTGEADLAAVFNPEYKDGVAHFNEYHRADSRTRLIYNDHLGFDHGAQALKEKLLQAAREIEAEWKKTGVCEGPLAGGPKILNLKTIDVPADTDASEKAAFRITFQNVGRSIADFNVWIDHCDDLAGKENEIWHWILQDGIVANVQPGETRTADVMVGLLKNETQDAVCRVRLGTSHRSWALDKWIELEDTGDVKLVRGAPPKRPWSSFQDSGKPMCENNQDCGKAEYCHEEIKACVAKSQCVAFTEKGPSENKIDLVFVGDGYADLEALKRDIDRVVDGGESHGLFSEEPFKSHQNKINIWMMNSQSNELHPAGSADWPNRVASLALAGKCPQADFPVVLSKNLFRSFAYFNGDAYISLAYTPEKDWGLVLLHELGHSFGGLADEYVETTKGSRPRAPNCASDQATAQKWWGATSGTGYFSGCGYAANNVRPTEHSLMRELSAAVGYGPVNTNELKKKLNRY